MNRVQVCAIAAGCCFGVAITAHAQNRKAGLWEVTSTMTWQQSPFTSGGPGSPVGGEPHTNTVCVTKEQIDKFGSPLPPPRGDCQVSNVEKSANGMTADMTCTGRMSGKATIVASWTDADHTISKMHFIGTLLAGQSPKPVEWTVDSTSVFKSTDCGDTKPIGAPAK